MSKGKRIPHGIGYNWPCLPSNTASLIGCGIENGFHLIFDFSPYGSLPSVLHGLELLTDGLSPQIMESCRMPSSETDEVDGYLKFDEDEYSQRFKFTGASP